MSDSFQEDALKEREEWLGSMKATEDMVHEDPISKLEFIFIKIDGGEALTRVFIPFAQQSKTIYNSHVIKVKKTT